MRVIKVNLKERSYKIYIGSKILNLLGHYCARSGLPRNAYIISNSFLKKTYGIQLAATLRKAGITATWRLIPDTEKSKSLAMAQAVIQDIVVKYRGDPVAIIAFGGGVVGDLAGFVASIYKRGIPFVQIPTTLLAQVDSSIGGKTAVDLPQGKNLVGSFYQPCLVWVDAHLLATLNERQYRSGLAEVIKYSLIKDRDMFNFLSGQSGPVKSFPESIIISLIARSCAIKAKIVSGDEKEEKGIRTVLNFGHTIGHAIEAAAGFSGVTHGEAVALGMLCAADISERLGLLRSGVRCRIEDLITRMGLPTAISGVRPAEIIKAHYFDKKFIGRNNRLVLLKDIGRTAIKQNIPLRLIHDVIAKRITR